MISVYRVIPDVTNFQYFMPDDVGQLENYRFDGTSLKEEWTPPDVYIGNPFKPKPDIWGGTFGAVFAVTSKAAIELTTFIDQSCEGLSLECDGETLLLCNVILGVNALDQKRSRHKEGVPHWFDEYVFHPHRFDYSLFKIPQTAMSEILCVEGRAAPHDEFKGFFEERGLTGLKFKKLWTGEDDH